MKKLLVFFSIIIISFTLINIYMIQLEREKARQNKICFIYQENSLPKFAIINQHKYDLTNTNKLQELFINQFDKEQLQNLEDCILLESR